jgi:hypothetical protein
MKIASGILSLLFGLIVMGQSFLVGIGGSIISDESMNQGGAVGLLVSLLLMVGGAFAFQVPKVALFFTGAASLFGLAAGATTVYSDMTAWGVVAIILTALNIINSRKPKRSANAGTSD